MATVNQSLEASVIIGGSSSEHLRSGDANDNNSENTFVSKVTAQTNDDVTAIFRENKLQSGDILPILGGVKIIRQLGEGNMGIVYLGERMDANEDTDRRIVIKVLKQNDDPEIYQELLQRLKSEASAAQAIGSIKDENLRFPQCFGYYALQKDGRDLNFIALEYIPGVDLDALLTISGKFPLQTVANLSIQFAQDLAIYHKNGIVHRDVKPGNARVSKRLITTDAGLAYQTGEKEKCEKDELTQAGTVLGSPVYISPEAWHDQAGSRDPKRDVFALGITLHQLITGKRPAEIETTDKYLDHYRYRQHIDVVDLNVFPISEDLNEMAFIKSLAELIRLMLHPNPALRISMADAQNYLQEMIIFPEKESGEVPINCSKDIFDPHQVLELLNTASSNIQLRGYGKQICDFDEKTFVSKEFRTGENIRTMQLSGRNRFEKLFRWGAGGTIAAGFLSALGYIDHLNRQNTFENSPIRVVTTPDLVEVPKPSSIDCLQDSEGTIAALVLNVNTPDFTTSIELDPSDALIMEINNASDKDIIENSSGNQKQYYLAFWCNTEQKMAAAKMIYANHDEPIPDAKNLQGLLVAFVLKDGTLIFHFPNIGLMVQKGNEIKTYTLPEIQQGKLMLENDTLDLIGNIQSGTVIHPIPEHILSENGFQNTKEMQKKLEQGIMHHPQVLLNEAMNHQITPVSATSSTTSNQ